MATKKKYTAAEARQLDQFAVALLPSSTGNLGDPAAVRRRVRQAYALAEEFLAVSKEVSEQLESSDD
jgi:hypothetical protein